MPVDCAEAAAAAIPVTKPAASATTIPFCARRRIPMSLLTRCQPLSKKVLLGPEFPENRNKLGLNPYCIWQPPPPANGLSTSAHGFRQEGAPANEEPATRVPGRQYRVVDGESRVRPIEKTKLLPRSKPIPGQIAIMGPDRQAKIRSAEHPGIE
jgi:hypothetical protein